MWPLGRSLPVPDLNCYFFSVAPETDEEKLVRFEWCLMQELPGLKYRQVIHPVLREGQSHINNPPKIRCVIDF